MKTWDDVLAAARGWPWSDEDSIRLRLNVTSSLFRSAVMSVEMGHLTREQAMIQAALALAEIVQLQHDQIVEFRANTIRPIIINHG